MAYSHDINPFTGILCIPYHYLCIVILLSWIPIWLEFSWRKYIIKYCDGPLKNAQKNISTTINNIIKNKLKSEFNKLIINNSRIPSDITSIIINMLPEIHENWKQQGKQYQLYIYIKTLLCKYSPYIFPTIKITANLLCFTVIILQYLHWLRHHSDLSNLNKYSSLIIALFYMPNFKGRGFHLFWFRTKETRFVVLLCFSTQNHDQPETNIQCFINVYWRCYIFHRICINISSCIDGWIFYIFTKCYWCSQCVINWMYGFCGDR